MPIGSGPVSAALAAQSGLLPEFRELLRIGRELDRDRASETCHQRFHAVSGLVRSAPPTLSDEELRPESLAVNSMMEAYTRTEPPSTQNSSQDVVATRGVNAMARFRFLNVHRHSSAPAFAHLSITSGVA